MDFISIFRGMIGILLLVGIAFLFSNNKKKINWRLVITGLSLQFIFALLIIKGDYFSQYFAPLGWAKLFFTWVSSFFVIVLNFTTEGATFIFGNLAISPGSENSMGMFFAFQVLHLLSFLLPLLTVFLLQT